MESRRIQDMLLTIHNSISNKAPRAIKNLINLLIYALLSTISGAKNMFYPYLKLILPNMDSSHGDILQPRNGMNYQMTVE